MYLGIDLGTSNSAIVGHVGGECRLFKTADGTDVLPSAIYVDKRGHRFIGKAAYDRLLSAPQSVGHGFKRSMGTKNKISIAGVHWTPAQCSSEIIKTLISQAQTESGDQEIQGAVITTPAAFNQMQSEDTIQAAQQAGLMKVSLLQEPVAAALAATAHSKQKDGIFLVYDLGGGTFDVALVISTAGVVNVIAHEGVNMLGGRDFDRIIFDSVIRPWLSSNFSLPSDFQAHDKYKHLKDICRYAAEKAKIQLSAQPTASIFAPEEEVRVSDENGEEIYVSIDLTRDQLAELIAEKIDESIDLCRKVIADNGYSPDDISKIVPIGGPSKTPVIRERLETELAIEVEKGLDPMTAVAMGAAIFAEGREWTDDTSSRKSGRRKEEISDDVSITLDYKDRVSSEDVKLRIKPGDDASGHEVEVLDEEGSSTGRVTLDGPIRLAVKARKTGPNKFKVNVFDSHGKLVSSACREIEVLRTEASAAGVPMTYNLAVKIQEGVVGYERNKLNTLVSKGTPLPTQGKQTFRAGKTLIGGEDDFIAVEFYEKSNGIDTPEHNLHIGNFRLNALDELERGERINRGDNVVIDWKMSDSGKLTFLVELPSLGRVIDASERYHPEDGGVDYDGPRGAELAASMLARAEGDLNELEENIDEKVDRDGKLRRRIEQQQSALSSSVDADTHRSVSEEARKIRQEVALLKMSPDLEDKVLGRDVTDAESSFDALRDSAQPVDADRHDKLLVSARRAIRDKNYDSARRSLDEMQAIRMKVLTERPDFLIEIFKRLAEERHLVVDQELHVQLVNEGVEAAKAGDTANLRHTIGQMFANRISSGADAAEIVELSHLLAS